MSTTLENTPVTCLKPVAGHFEVFDTTLQNCPDYLAMSPSEFVDFINGAETAIYGALAFWVASMVFTYWMAKRGY